MVAIIRNEINFHVSADLTSSIDECEILWVDIVNKSSKNSFSGIIYRHASSSLETSLNKLFSCIDIVN